MIGFDSSSYTLEDECIGRFSLSVVLKGNKITFVRSLLLFTAQIGELCDKIFGERSFF